MEHFGNRGLSHRSCLGERVKACYEIGPLRITLYPKDPEDVWVRWAVTFISQRAVHWKSECVQAPPELKRQTYINFLATFFRLQDLVPLRFWRRFSANLFDPTAIPEGDLYFGWVTKYSLRHAILESIFETGEGLPFAFPSPLYLMHNCMFDFQPQHLISLCLSAARQKESLLGAGLTPTHLELFAVVTCISSWKDSISLHRPRQDGGRVLLPVFGYAPFPNAKNDLMHLREDNWASLRGGLERRAQPTMDSAFLMREKAASEHTTYAGNAMKRLWVSLLRSCVEDPLQRPIPVRVLEMSGNQLEWKFAPTWEFYEEILHACNNVKGKKRPRCIPGYVKLRILEECQNSLLGLWDAKTDGIPSRKVSGKSIEAMLFCILAYPGLTLLVRDDPEQKSGRLVIDENISDRAVLQLQIFSDIGPQKPCVEVEFALYTDKPKKGKLVAIMRLTNCEETAVSSDDAGLTSVRTISDEVTRVKFDWQLWKDTFVRTILETSGHAGLPEQLFDVTVPVLVPAQFQLPLFANRFNTQINMICRSVLAGRLNGNVGWRGWEWW